MSGRQGEGGSKPGRSQQNFQSRTAANLGRGTGPGSRGSGFQGVSGRGVGVPGSTPQGAGANAFGLSQAAEPANAAYKGQGEGRTQQRALSAQMPTRGVTLPQGMNTFPQAQEIVFGTIATSEDGSLNNMPSPQPQEQPGARSPPQTRLTGAGRGSTARGGPRPNGRAHSRASAGRGQQMQVPQPNFGSGVPHYNFQQPVHSYTPYGGYGMGSQPPYPGYQTMYQMQYPPHMVQQAPARPPPNFPPAYNAAPANLTPRAMEYSAPKEAGTKYVEPRKSKALTITNPTTKQPVLLERPTTAPVNGATGPRKQPSQGSPMPKAGQPGVPSGAATSRALNISAPPAARPSKPSQASPAAPSANGQVAEPSQASSEPAASEKVGKTAAATLELHQHSPVAEASQLEEPKADAGEANTSADAEEVAAAKVKADADAKAKAEAEAKATAAAEEAAKKAAEEVAAQEAAAAKKVEEEQAAAAEKAAQEAAAIAAEAESARQAAEEAEKRQLEEEKRAAEDLAAKKVEEERYQEEASAQAAPEQELGSSRSSSEEAPAQKLAAAAPAPPKKKGKKALNAAIAARKSAETAQYDNREADLGAFKSQANNTAAAATASSAPATEMPSQSIEADKAPSLPESTEDDVDWEEKKIETPRAPAPTDKEGSQLRQYSKDFLLKINKSLLDSQAVEQWEGLSHMENANSKLLRAAGMDFQSGRGGMRGPPPHMGAARGDDRWLRGKPLAGGQAGGFQPPGMGGPPPPPGRGGRGAGRIGVEADRWSRGNPLPPIPNARPAPALHKADERYETGRLKADDPEEDKRQRDFKSLLNKLTPEKYQIIFQKMLEVGINAPVTLYGLIDQVFDKALSESVFCELYATLCRDLSKALPEFDPEPDSEDGKKVNFRRSLLNKCQIEFEHGTRAMEAVEAREEADARAKEDDAEPGEIKSEDDKVADRRKEMEEALMEQKARRRALGNIQFVGHLWKHRMLTEKIMHSCIQTLLTEVEKPRNEDIECLCKLMATIGGQLEASPKAKGHIDNYCVRMKLIRDLPHLESRLKFMIQDILDMRRNGWQLRRKVEGPKAIEEIHRDAEREQQAQTAATRYPMDRYGGRGSRGGGGFREPPQPVRPMRSRHEDRLEEKPRPMQRTPSQDGLFAPQGGRSNAGGGFRPGGSLASRAPPTLAREPAQSRESPTPSGPPPRQEAAPSTRPKAEGNAPQAAGLPVPEEQVRTKAKGLLVEYAHLRSESEVSLILTEELPASRANLAVAVQTWLTTAFETRGMDQTVVKELFAFVTAEDLVPKAAIQEGLTAILEELHDTATDVPFAPELVGRIMGDFLASSPDSLAAMAGAVQKAGMSSEDYEEGSDPPLVDSGYASKVMATALETFAAQVGRDDVTAAWKACNLQILDFFPSFEREDEGVVAALATKHNLQSVF